MGEVIQLLSDEVQDALAERVEKLEVFNERYAMTMLEGKAVVIYRDERKELNQIVTQFTIPHQLTLLHKNQFVPRLKKKRLARMIIRTTAGTAIPIRRKSLIPLIIF